MEVWLGGEELVGEAGLAGEEGGGFFGDGLVGFFEVVGDFEDGGGVGGKGGEEAGYVLPVDCDPGFQNRLRAPTFG